PPFFPFVDQLGACDVRSGAEFVIAVSPRFFAVGGEEVREPGFQIPAQMPDDDCYGVPVTRAALDQLIVTKLCDCFVAELFVSAVFTFYGFNQCSHGTNSTRFRG